MFKTASDYDLNNLVKLSIGRILQIGSRPGQPGDGAEYDKYRDLAMNAIEELSCRK